MKSQQAEEEQQDKRDFQGDYNRLKTLFALDRIHMMEPQNRGKIRDARLAAQIAVAGGGQ